MPIEFQTEVARKYSQQVVRKCGNACKVLKMISGQYMSRVTAGMVRVSDAMGSYFEEHEN